MIDLTGVKAILSVWATNCQEIPIGSEADSSLRNMQCNLIMYISICMSPNFPPIKK